jgi:hypothetical protein
VWKVVVVASLVWASGCSTVSAPSSERQALKMMGGEGCGFERISGPENVWARMCLEREGGEILLQLHADRDEFLEMGLYVVTLYHLGETLWRNQAPGGTQSRVKRGSALNFERETRWRPEAPLGQGAYVVEVSRAGDDSRVANFSLMVQ